MTEVASRSGKALETVAAKVAVSGLALLGSIVVARALGPSGRGAYFVIVTIASTALALGHFSLGQAHVLLWAKGEDRRTLAANAVAMGLALGTGAAGIAWAIVTVAGPRLVPLADRGLLLVALAAVPLGTITLYMNGLLVLDDRIGRVNAAALVAAIGQTGAFVALAAAGKLSVGAVVVLWVVATGLPLVLTLRSFGTGVRHLSAAFARRAVGVGARYHLGMVAIFLLWRSDVFLLNALTTRREVGLYSLAVTLAELTYLVTDSIAQVVLPRQVAGSLHDAGQLTAATARTNLLVALLAVAGILATGPLLIPLMFGRAFAGSLPAVAALSVGVIALAMIRPVGGFLIRLDRPLVISCVSVAALGLNVALNLAFIPRWGIVGAGAASSIAYAALAFFYLGWLRRAAGLRTRELLPRLDDLRRPVTSLLSYRPGWLP